MGGLIPRTCRYGVRLPVFLHSRGHVRLLTIFRHLLHNRRCQQSDLYFVMGSHDLDY